MNDPQCKSLDDIYDDCFDWYLSDEIPKRYSVGLGFEQVRLEPKRIMIIGAPPGSGKTSLVMQWMFDAMRLDSNVKVVVCNVEMPPEMLVCREISRYTGIPSTWIIDKRHRHDSTLKRKINVARDAMTEFRKRMIFVYPPYTLDNIRNTVGTHDADVLVIDYLQRIQSDNREKKDKRQMVMGDMSVLRKWADAGLAIIGVSSVSRNSYDSIRMDSFSESSEIEYGADVGYGLEPYKDNKTQDTCDGMLEMILKTVKPPRYASPHNIIVRFDKKHHRFDVLHRGVDE